MERGASSLEPAQMGRLTKEEAAGSPAHVQAQKGTGSCYQQCQPDSCSASPMSPIQTVPATFSRRANTAGSFLLNAKHVLS